MTTKVMDCDLVVLGAAGCGLVAAVKAADVSGKKVIVLEKAKKSGGASVFAHGMGDIKDSNWQKEAGIAVNGNFEVLNTKGEVMPGVYAGGDGCTIFGGKTIIEFSGVLAGAGPSTAVGPADGAPGASTANTNILSGECFPCAGLGAVVLSGYIAGINAVNYLKNI